jgi:DNA-binding response OmpR family regulator
MPTGKHKILLLEDDPVRALIFESVVKRGVGEMMTCPDVATALRHLKGRHFDLCVVDLGVYLKGQEFDDRGGIEFVATARGEITRTIPMIIVTSVRDPKALIPCFEAGADDYVVKDETMEATFKRIRSWLNGAPYSNTYLEQKRREILYALRAREAAEEEVEWF